MSDELTDSKFTSGLARQAYSVSGSGSVFSFTRLFLTRRSANAALLTGRSGHKFGKTLDCDSHGRFYQTGYNVLRKELWANPAQIISCSFDITYLTSVDDMRVPPNT